MCVCAILNSMQKSWYSQALSKPPHRRRVTAQRWKEFSFKLGWRWSGFLASYPDDGVSSNPYLITRQQPYGRAISGFTRLAFPYIAIPFLKFVCRGLHRADVLLYFANFLIWILTYRKMYNTINMGGFVSVVSVYVNISPVLPLQTQERQRRKPCRSKQLFLLRHFF